MSKVFKGIKKVFKKVIDVVKKVAPIILAAAAIYFTAGMALAGTAGWAGVVGGATTSLGTGVLGSTVTGAITGAGYGAAIGGITSAMTGGNFSDGAGRGAVSGAISGGLIRGVGAFGNGATSVPGQTPGIGDGTGAGTVGQPGIDPNVAGAFEDLSGMGGAPPAQVAPAPVTSTGADGLGVSTSHVPKTVDAMRASLYSNGGGGGGIGGLARNVGGWFNDNPVVGGNIINGIGQGLMAGSTADSYRDLQREKFANTAGNYAGTDPGRNFRDMAPPQSTTPRQDRFEPRSYGSFEYQYDPSQGRIVRVPVGG